MAGGLCPLVCRYCASQSDNPQNERCLQGTGCRSSIKSFASLHCISIKELLRCMYVVAASQSCTALHAYKQQCYIGSAMLCCLVALLQARADIDRRKQNRIVGTLLLGKQVQTARCRQDLSRLQLYVQLTASLQSICPRTSNMSLVQSGTMLLLASQYCWPFETCCAPAMTWLARSAPSRAAKRSCSSLAALLLKVMTTISHGLHPFSLMRYSTRDVSTRVLPLPGPAIILEKNKPFVGLLPD